MSYKIVWKVIRKDNRNSACVHGGAELNYPVGQVVKPVIKNSLIMAFDTKEHAASFACRFDIDLTIVRCKARISERKLFPYCLAEGTAAYPFTVKAIERYWSFIDKEPSMPFILRRYPGTVLCNQVTPLE